MAGDAGAAVRWPSRAVAGRLVVTVAALMAIGACSSIPQPSAPLTPTASLTPAALKSGAIGVARATLVEPLVPIVGDRPDGPEMRSEPDGNPAALEKGRKVVILGAPQPGPRSPMVRVWVEPSTEVWPGDFYAWLPTIDGVRQTLQLIEPARCPAEATIQTLAPLVQQDRLICAGSTTVTIDARSGQLGSVPLYDVDPAWYGTNAGPATAALFDPGPARFGPAATLSPEAAGAWIEPRVPPDVPLLPFGLFLRVTGQFDHPSAAGCRRAIPNAIAGMGLPAEAAAESAQWCREQFVVSAWQALLGPEGRPIDLADPQLHRREFAVPPGARLACGGVGMPPLTVRIDLAQPDPVWIETPGGHRSMARFGPEFHLRSDPVRVEATNGVTLVSGEILDPDKGKPGLALCPGGDVISFDVLPAAP